MRPPAGRDAGRDDGYEPWWDNPYGGPTPVRAGDHHALVVPVGTRAVADESSESGFVEAPRHKTVLHLGHDDPPDEVPGDLAHVVAGDGVYAWTATRLDVDRIEYLHDAGGRGTPPSKKGYLDRALDAVKHGLRSPAADPDRVVGTYRPFERTAERTSPTHRGADVELHPLSAREEPTAYGVEIHHPTADADGPDRSDVVVVAAPESRTVVASVLDTDAFTTGEVRAFCFTDGDWGLVDPSTVAPDVDWGPRPPWVDPAETTTARSGRWTAGDRDANRGGAADEDRSDDDRGVAGR